MVEAAIFFPITIFAVMAVFALLLNLYSQTSLQAHMHMSVRAEAAADGDRVSVRVGDAYVRDRYRSEAESVSIALEEGRVYGVKTVEADRTKTYYGGSLTNRSGYEREFFGRWYVIDESGYARIRGVV
ncbi:MAG: hypothetical protein LBN12_08775 [Clostridiales Family XIII bacterium]|jgi:hypothetical protein|nr:hypothetical protein [Clostridiales Family XIII bacterium]